MKHLRFLLYTLFPGILLIFSGCDNNNPVNSYNGEPMSVIANYPAPGTALDSYVKNINGTDYAFVSMGSSGVLILDVTNPSSIHTVAGYNISGYCEEAFPVIIRNVPYLFIASGGSGLNVLDISNINSPVLDTLINFSGDYLSSVFVDTATSIAYTGGSLNKMYVLNIASLPVVSVISTYQSYSNINEIQVANNTAYIAQDGGLDIVNVSTPANPVRYTLGTSNDYAYDVKISGNLAFVSNNENGVVVFNISNPSNPQQLGVLETSDIALACTVNGNLVYVAEDVSGVETFDVSDPNNPRYLAYYSTGSYSENVFFYNGLVFVSDMNDYVILRYP